MSDRPNARMWFVVAAVLVGAAIGMLVYRYAVLGLFWTGAARHVITGAGIGLIVGARAMVKGREGRPPSPVLLGAGVVGAAVAFGIAHLALPTLGRAALETREFPGFTLGLPPGDVKTEVNDYLAGKSMMNRIAGTNAVVAVQWEAGAPSREDLELGMKALGPTLGTRSAPALTTLAGPGGARVDTASLETDKGTMRMSQLPCGKRNITVMTLGPDEMSDLHARILSTLVCRPDPAREPGEDGVVALHVELPGFVVDSREPMMVTLTNGQSYLTLRQLAAGDPTPLDQLLPAMMNAMGGQITTSAVVDGRTPLSGTLGGEAVHGWGRYVRCPGENIMLLALSPDRATADALAAATAGARCLRQGESAPSWPDPPAPATP